jgi:hypothetical protein
VHSLGEDAAADTILRLENQNLQAGIMKRTSGRKTGGAGADDGDVDSIGHCKSMTEAESGTQIVPASARLRTTSPRRHEEHGDIEPYSSPRSPCLRGYVTVSDASRQGCCNNESSPGFDGRSLP